MPLFQFFSFVGAALLALLFVADSYLPKPAERQETERSYKIRIASEVASQQAITFSGHPRQFLVADIATPVATRTEATPPVAGDLPRDSLAQMTSVAAPVRVDDVRPQKRVAKSIKPRPKVQEPAPSVFGWTTQSPGYARFN